MSAFHQVIRSLGHEVVSSCDVDVEDTASERRLRLFYLSEASCRRTDSRLGVSVN